MEVSISSSCLFVHKPPYTIPNYSSVLQFCFHRGSLCMDKSRSIMLNFLPIMLLSTAQKVAYYAQYYAHDYSNYAIFYI